MCLQNWVDQNSQHIKERWLFFAIICAGYSIIHSSFLAPVATIPLLCLISIHTIVLVVLYYFAYRKPGTRFLTFVLFMKLLGLIGLVELLHAGQFQMFSIVHYLIPIDFSLAIGWLVLGAQLRKINIRARPLYNYSRIEVVKNN